MPVKIKYCGLTRPEDVVAAVAADASYLGFNYFPKSPRFVRPELAAALGAGVPAHVTKVALVVDMDDPGLDDIVERARPDMIQLHGSESVARVAAVKMRYGLPVMKVLGVGGPEDVARIGAFEAVADQILVDAKPPKDAVLPGGNGLAFDWTLIAGLEWSVPWMLAGGLTSENVAEAVALTGAREVDLASGVEKAPGVKDAAMMQAFAAALNRH